MDQPRLEVADIFRRYGEAYRSEHGSRMSPQQHRVMRDIELCRTAALGGHVDACDDCGHQVISYNSCRNRHCPKCQSLAKARWLEARRAELLPVEYFHVIFTVPDPLLGPLALQNQRVFYDLLFHTVAQALLTTAADPDRLGAYLGFVAVLHTWGQKLNYHAHVHCVVPGGGLASDGQRWISCSPRFFLNVEALSDCFKEILLRLLQKAFQKGQLEFHGTIRHLAEPQAFEQLTDACEQIDWVVYSKPPFGGPENVLDYLGRYTHRIAISNHRLVDMKDGKVTFTWKDYSDGCTEKTIPLDAHEFIRRFLMHVLPDGFVRIRYFGFLANRHRAEKLLLCRDLLDVTDVPLIEEQKWPDLVLSLTGKDPLLCPKCHRGRLVRIQTLPPMPKAQISRTRGPPAAAFS